MSDTTPLRSDWGSLSGLSPDRVWKARVQAHYALQLPAALHALGALFGDASALLDELRPTLTSPSAARLWPHHFDVAVLDDLGADAGPGPERRRSVGVGMTPGDEGTREPYLYVTPWPYPAAPRLPPLPDGTWTTDGWVGALLLVRTLADDTPAGRTARARAFVDAAIRGSRRMLAVEGDS